MIDGDGTSFETIGEIETNVGALMGAKAQTFSAPLEWKGNKKRGTIIVRCEAVQQSNHTAKFGSRWHDLNTKQGGCLGMCGSIEGVTFEIGRQVPGQNTFVRIDRSPIRYESGEVILKD